MRWQRAIFSVELCIHRQHCAVNWIKVGKIIRHLRLPQFAVRQPDLIPSYMTCRHSGQGNGDGLHRMGKSFPSMMILHCPKKKSETVT